MKICFVAPANNYHTKKWCNWFLARGYEIHVVSFIDDVIPNVNIHFIDAGVNAQESDFSKIRYLLYFSKVKRIIKDIKPDIINVHYATSYGTVVALSGVKPYILSVWGSDIYDFPYKSIFHKLMLKYSLSKAAYLFSTSQAMAEEAAKYTKKNFVITPFGVDMNLFQPSFEIKNTNKFVVGTVKGISAVYGIDYLLKAVSIVHSRYPEIDIRLRIAGTGDAEKEYKALADKLGVSNITTWLGFISQEQAAVEWKNMDVAVIYSNQESFGVSAVEAQACGIPLIISDVSGLKEATEPQKTCIVVPKKNEYELAKSIKYLYDNPDLRREMGIRARKYVLKMYELNSCFYKIEETLKLYIKENAND
jgi:Glycosyltransferase